MSGNWKSTDNISGQITAVLNGSFLGKGSITADAAATFYGANGISSTNGIWAALINNGSFSGMPSRKILL